MFRKSRNTYKLAVGSALLAGTFMLTSCGLFGGDEGDVYSQSECNPGNLGDIDPALGGDDTRERISGMIIAAKGEEATQVELEALIAIAYSETAFGGKKVPDADKYDIYSQRITKGIQADPQESTRMMLDRIREVKTTETDAGVLAAKAVRSNDRHRYAKVIDTATEIIDTIGGC